MKNRRIQSMTLLALACLSALSCAKFSGAEKVLPQEEDCLVTLSVGGEQQTRVDNYTTVFSYERQISNLQIIIYDKSSGASGTWPIAYSTRETYSPTVTSASLSMRLPAGEYYVVAVANADEDFTGLSYSDIGNNFTHKHYLGYDEDYATGGFQAYNEKNLTINDGATSASISMTLNRLVGRVVLHGIYNRTGQTVTINHIWLSNVVTKYEPFNNYWGNIMGRYDYSNSASIIDSESDAECPTCTYFDVNETLYNNDSFSDVVALYALRNDSTVTPSGWSSWSDSDGQKTTLIIDATVDGNRCYYPVVLNSIVSNATYTVSVNLYRIGSPDPNDPNGEIVTDVSFTATVTVNEWYDGVEYYYEY